MPKQASYRTECANPAIRQVIVDIAKARGVNAMYCDDMNRCAELPWLWLTGGESGRYWSLYGCTPQSEIARNDYSGLETLTIGGFISQIEKINVPEGAADFITHKSTQIIVESDGTICLGRNKSELITPEQVKTFIEAYEGFKNEMSGFETGKIEPVGIRVHCDIPEFQDAAFQIGRSRGFEVMRHDPVISMFSHLVFTFGLGKGPRLANCTANSESYNSTNGVSLETFAKTINTFPKYKRFTIGGYEVIIANNGDVDFGCTPVRAPMVDAIIKKFQSLTAKVN